MGLPREGQTGEISLVSWRGDSLGGNAKYKVEENAFTLEENLRSELLICHLLCVLKANHLPFFGTDTNYFICLATLPFL